MLDASRRAAAAQILRLKEAESSFLGYVRLMRPKWKIPNFHLHLIDILDRFEKGALLHPKTGEPVHNLLVNMPVRHSKSAYCTELFPGYYMSRRPQRHVMTASYGDALAQDFGRKVRDLIADPLTPQIFPACVLDPTTRAVDHWRTTEGGNYFGIGMQGTTSGRPANLLILDDPIKNRTEAESATLRNRQWDTYTSTLSARLEPEIDGTPPKQIVVLTRWHVDDLGGRLQDLAEWEEGLWYHVNFPALSMDEHGVEHALWPERFNVAWLNRRRALAARDFASLYQQTPYIAGGNLIKTKWWQRYSEEFRPTDFVSLVIAADTAFKSSETSDYTAIVIAGLTKTGDIYILDVMRQRWEYPDLRRKLIALNALWRGKGLRAIYVEDKASGQSLIQELRRESGLAVVAHKVVHDKVSRLNAVLPLIEGGRVFLPEEAPWLDPYLAEMLAFPSGDHDDQVDATVIALDVLAKVGMMPDMGSFSTDMHQSLNSFTPAFGKSLGSLVDHKKVRFFGWGR